MTMIKNLNVGVYVISLVRPLIVLTNSGLTKIHALDVVCTSCTNLIRTFGVLIRNFFVKPTEFNLYDNSAYTKNIIMVVCTFSFATCNFFSVDNYLSFGIFTGTCHYAF